MSRIYDTYVDLKKQDSNTYYLFQTGLFYVFIGEDARIAGSTFNLKCNKLTEKVIKCGFPKTSLTKYQVLFEQLHMKVKIVELEKAPKELTNVNLVYLLSRLQNVDLNQTSPLEAWTLLRDIKEELENG